MPKTAERVFRGAALLSALTAYADSAEGKVRKAFLKAIGEFTKQGDFPTMLEQYRRGEITAEQLPARIDQLEMNADEINALVRKAVGAGGTITAKKAQLELDWDVIQPEVLAAARDLTLQQVRYINSTTQKALADLIHDAIATGMDRDELIRKIKGMVGLMPSHVTAVNNYEQGLVGQGIARKQINKLVKSYTERLLNYRARMIGRTEVAQALNVGQDQFWKQMQGKGMLPSNTQRQWITGYDEKVCDICGPMDGELAPLGGVWTTAIGYVQVPTDTHPNCRCAMGLVFPDIEQWWPAPSLTRGGVSSKGLEKIFKFNPYHDKEGRFTTAGAAFTIGAMPASMRGTASHVAALASAKEGFTYDQKRGEFRRSGFAVSPFPEHEATFTLDEWARSGPELVKKYMAEKADVLAQPNSHVGGWKGEDRQGRVRIYLDVSVVRRDQNSAANLARRHAQISYFDLGRGYEMRQKNDKRYYSYSYDVGDFVDPDEIGKAVTRQGSVYFIAPRDARDPAALLTFVNTISDSQPVLMGSALSKFNPYHDAAGRFSSADQAASGWGANDWRNKLPASPGTTPVPEGALRLWHYTSDSALDSIEQTGLQMTSARGESYGEPNLIWGSAQTPDFSVIDTRPRIEFYVLPEEVGIGRPNVGESGKAWADRLTRANAHVTTTTDIEPSRIIIHHKWHRAVRYMEREILAEVLAGEHDNLVGDKNYAHYGKAIEYLKTKHGVSKFNPYHDERGRFTSANAATTISGGALGANRELTVSMVETALGGSLTGREKTLLREAPAGDLDFARGHPRSQVGITLDSTLVAVSDADRGDVKNQGAKAIVKEMTRDELRAVFAAVELQGIGVPTQAVIDEIAEQGFEIPSRVEQFVGQQHNQWAVTAGDNKPEALAIQVSAAEMQGWDDQQIADRVFRQLSREDVATAREIAKVVVESHPAEVLLGGWRERETAIHEAAKEHETYVDTGLVPDATVGRHGTAAHTFVMSALLGDAHKAVLAANQRVAQYELKKAVGDSPTITLFRGVDSQAYTGDLESPLWESDLSSGSTIRSQSSPLSSWSVSQPEAAQFTGGGASRRGALLRAEVPVSSIVGLSSVGFGCVVEGEVIVNGDSFTATVSPPKEFPTGDPFPVEKAILTINLDATDINQDWPKRTPDTYAALGLPSPISKFNPYHDELGRFSSANAAVTISGGALGANRELTISLVESALSLSSREKTMLREAPAGDLAFTGDIGVADPTTVDIKNLVTGGALVRVNQEDRGTVKELGAKAIADEMTWIELAECEAAMRLQGAEEPRPSYKDPLVGAERIPTEPLAEQFVAEQHNLWADTAGDSNPKALSIQVAAAEMQGWDDEQIADRVFRDATPTGMHAARQIAKLVLESNDPEVLLGGWLERSDAISAARKELHWGETASSTVAAETFIYSELLGDAHKAVLAANQRVAQRDLKAAVGDAPTITLFRGVQIGGDQLIWQGDSMVRPESGTRIRSQSSPLSSWSVSRPEAVAFAGGFSEGVLIRADVPVSSIVGLSSSGFGCIIEGEVIVSGASFTATVAERNPPPVIEMKVGEAKPAGGNWLQKAIPTINLDSTDTNQDWPKRTPDTYEALGLPSPISKFNPYHDELGRFTSAGGAKGVTTYTGGRGYHEGTIEVTDYNGEPRLLMPITSYVEEGTELPDGRITEGGYHIDEKEAGALAREVFEVELELKDADGKPIKVITRLQSGAVMGDGTQYARIKVEGALMLKEEGVEEYYVGQFKGEIDPFGESNYIAGDVFGAPRGPGGETVKDGKPLASIDGLYINPRDLQGLGIGTTLMAHWEDQLARTGVDRITIEAVSNTGGLTGGYSWMKYGYTPVRGAVNSVLSRYVGEKVESDWALPSAKSIGNLAAMLGLPSHIAHPYFNPLQRLEQIQSHMPYGEQWEAITEDGTTNENFGSYEARHGQDWAPVLEAIPEFKDYALSEVRWYGSKKLETIEKAATPALSPQIEATIRVANRWMRENPAGLENDDDAFWAEVAEARASAPIKKFNPHHDELGRFTSGPGGSAEPTTAAGYKKGKLKVADTDHNPRDWKEMEADHDPSDMGKKIAAETHAREIFDLSLEVEGIELVDDLMGTPRVGDATITVDADEAYLRYDGEIEVHGKLEMEVPDPMTRATAEHPHGEGTKTVLVGTFKRTLFPDTGTVDNEIYKLLPNFQGQGIGTTVLAHWEDQLSKAGYSVMETEAMSNRASLNGAYTWLKYGYTPKPGEAHNLVAKFLQHTERDPTVVTPKGLRNLRSLVGMSAARAPDVYVDTHGDDLFPLIDQVPAFTEFLKNSDVSWYGEKRTSLLRDLEKADPSPQLAAQVEVANRWMRENPVGLENDDPKFWDDVREARNRVSKFNPHHDELGRFTTAQGDAYGGDTDRFTWAGSDLQDSPLQNKGAAVTKEAPGVYKVEYGDLVETVTDDHEAGFAEEGNTHWGMWEGNYQMRNASAALMGLTPPLAKGGDDRHADPNMNEAYATGWVEGLSPQEQQNMARDIHTVNKVVKEISRAEEDAPLLHRGMTDVDPDSHLLTAPIGSTYVTPLTAYSSDPAVAVRFTTDDQSPHRPEVMVIVKPGSKAVHSSEDAYGGDIDHYRTATGWVTEDYAPVEHVSQGRYRIVDRIRTTALGSDPRDYVRPITTVIVEQVSTYAPGYGGWSDNTNEGDALPPGMREGLASDVRQLEMFEGDLYKAQDVIPDWVWAMTGSLASGRVKKYNPHHDELGRFSSGPGGGVSAGPKRGQPHAAKRKPSRLGMTGEPNPVTGKAMSNTEFGDTMETLFRQRAGRQAGFKKMFGARLRALVGHGEQARTGALDYRTDTFGIEVKSLNTRSKDKRVKIARRAAAAKRKEVERMGLKGGIAVQVVDFDRGVVTLYGWDKGFTNPSTKASPTSVNIQFSPVTQGAKLGEYRFTRSQWHKAQKETTRMDARGRLKGTWGDYDPPDTMGKMDDLARRAELRKARDEADPLPRPDAVQRLMKDREAPMTDEDERIEAGDTVIQLVEQEGKWVPHIYEAE